MKVVVTQWQAPPYVEGEVVCRHLNHCFLEVNQARVREPNKTTKMGLGQ